MEGLEVGWLETTFKKHTEDRNIARILSVTPKKALGPGENYMSDIMRIKIKAVLGSGRIVTRSYIAKKKNGQAEEMITRYQLFRMENRMYNEIFPLMEQLMEEACDYNDYLWADYLGSTEDIILLEDLKMKGFKLTDRQNCQDLNHAMLTVKNLARFHAMSAVLLARGLINPKQFEPTVFSRNDEIINKMFVGGIETLADTIESTWDPKWRETAVKLRDVGGKIGIKLQELCCVDENVFKVVNHGDCWTNNMLFKYETGSNFPIGLRFVDYQCPHYNSYAWDLTYFFYTSIRPTVRHNQRNELISAYQKALLSTLEFYNCVPDNIPTVDDIEKEMDRLLIFGLMGSATLLPMTMADPSKAMDIRDFVDESVTVVQNKDAYLNKVYQEFIESDLEYFASKGLL